MEEEELKSSINTYKQQLTHVEQAIQAAGSTPDLDTLKHDLEELIQLTEESLLSLRKSQLLKQLDGDHGTTAGSSSQSNSAASNSMDDEYAAFQAMMSGESDVHYIDNSSLTKGDNLNHTKGDNLNFTKEDHWSSTNGDNVDSTKGDNLNFAKGNNWNSTKGDNLNSTKGGNVNSTKGDNLDDDDCDTPSVSDMYKDIIGTKCRAPFVHEWGAKTHSNALIASLESDSDLEIPKVRVMYCNPTHLSMLPCKYYLNGNCRFTPEDCRYSHGHIVELEDLQEYKDPDFSLLKLESRCLARYDYDDIWYKATIVDLHDDNVKVTFDTYDDEPITVPYQDIFPLDEADQASSDSDDDQPMRKEDSDDDDELPVFLWKPPSHGLGDLGQWEAHTKGIGSRLLTKMGYVPGQGLGKSGEGRIQPVPIQLLPQGKSLDKIMLLKEIAGDRDMFDVMHKQEKKMKKQVEKLEKQYLQSESKPSVFDFINKKLHGKKGKLSELLHKHGGEGDTGSSGHGTIHRNISEHDLKSKSDRNINIQLMKTGEEMKSVEKQLIRLKQSLSRNENRDRNMASQVKQKIQSMESYLEKLKSSESTMQIHQQKRSDHRKLTVF